MNERRELERDLRALADELAWPETPDVAAQLGERLAADLPPARSSHWRLALAVALAFVVAATAAVPPVRGAIGRVLGIAGNERIERVEQVPQDAPRLDLGRPVTLREASASAGFEVVLPRSLGAPDGIRLGGDLGHRAVSLLYGSDTVLTETSGVYVVMAVKLIGPGVSVHPVVVDGAHGFWIARGPRVIAVPDDRGGTVRIRAALPGSGVLLWDRAGVGLRLETRRSQAEALAIARSVR